jgi:hypothetical protein
MVAPPPDVMSRKVEAEAYAVMIAGEGEFGVVMLRHSPKFRVDGAYTAHDEQ